MVLSNDYINGNICVFRLFVDFDRKSLILAFRERGSIMEFITLERIKEFNNLISLNYAYIIISFFSIIISITLLRNLLKA